MDANGVAGAATTTVTVNRILWWNGGRYVSDWDSPTTDSGGFWWVPGDSHTVNPSQYTMSVTVTGPSGEGWGSDTDSC